MSDIQTQCPTCGAHHGVHLRNCERRDMIEDIARLEAELAEAKLAVRSEQHPDCVVVLEAGYRALGEEIKERRGEIATVLAECDALRSQNTQMRRELVAARSALDQCWLLAVSAWDTHQIQDCRDAYAAVKAVLSETK